MISYTKLTKITDSKYIIASTDVSLIRHRGKYVICKSNIPARWSPRFVSIEAADQFIYTHDVVAATASQLPISADDIEYIVSAYGFDAEDDVFVHSIGPDSFISLRFNPEDVEMSIEDDGLTSTFIFTAIDDLLIELDKLLGNPVLASTRPLSCSETRRVIMCAKKTSREAAKDLVRVKSSNIWAYGMNIKQYGDKAGDLLIQFKGPKGGPGDIYLYIDVPIKLYQKFLTAPSAGHFFWVNIRNNFLYRKLTGDKKTHLKNGLN